MHVSVGAHIGHTAVANFYIDPVKKSVMTVIIFGVPLQWNPSAMEHQKLHGKLSEHVPLTTQTVSAVFYV